MKRVKADRVKAWAEADRIQRNAEFDRGLILRSVQCAPEVPPVKITFMGLGDR